MFHDNQTRFVPTDNTFKRFTGLPANKDSPRLKFEINSLSETIILQILLQIAEDGLKSLHG